MELSTLGWSRGTKFFQKLGDAYATMDVMSCGCESVYRCSSCGQCYQHEHRAFCLLGVQWYWEHPVRVVDNRSPWHKTLRGPVVFDSTMAYQEPDVVYW